MQNVGGHYKMQQLSIHINLTDLSKLLQKTFERLPKEYSKALEYFLNTRLTTYFRESLISKWISIPVDSNIVFKQYDTTHRLSNIFIETTKGNKSELQVYLNQYGIFGIKIRENLEDLIIETVDTTEFVIEKVPVSKYLSGDADLEYLDNFRQIDDYLDNKYASEVYTINETIYFSIITLSDKNCIAIAENNSVFLLNKVSGLTKLISKRPEDFVNAFQNNKLAWLDNIE